MNVMTFVRFAALALATLVLGHDLTFLAANGLDGLGVALRETGHDPYWPFTWLLAVAAVVGLAILAVVRGARLALALRTGRATVRWGSLRTYVGEALRLWPRLLAVGLAALVVQESVEHYALHDGHLLALADFVSGPYRALIPALVLAALLVSAVAALFVRTLAVLEEAARRAATPVPRAVRRLEHPAVELIVRLAGSLATPDIGRAPPAPIVR